MSSPKYERGLTEIGIQAAKDMGEWIKEEEKILESLSPDSPDGEPSRYDKDATKILGGGRVKVFRTDTGYFFAGKDEYINEEDIAHFAPKLLESLKVTV